MDIFYVLTYSSTVKFGMDREFHERLPLSKVNITLSIQNVAVYGISRLIAGVFRLRRVFKQAAGKAIR